MEFVIIVIVAAIAVILAAKSAEGSSNSVTRKNPSPFDDLIDRYSRENGIRFEILKALIKKESNFNPNAWNDERKKGDPSDDAIGLMQIRALALTDYNRAHNTSIQMKELYNPESNIKVGSWYVAKFIKKYGEQLGLEIYNVGETGYRNGVTNLAYVSNIQQNAKLYV